VKNINGTTIHRFSIDQDLTGGVVSIQANELNNLKFVFGCHLNKGLRNVEARPGLETRRMRIFGPGELDSLFNLG
jgi:hypothetical protein